jgi:hypothetical protein
VVTTVPATLLEAVPSGSLDATLSTHSARAAKQSHATLARAAAAAVACKGNVAASIKPDPSFGANLTLKAAWKFFGGLQSASLTASAHASDSITATLTGKGSCTLGKTPVVSLPGPSVETFVGPIPVVMTSKITIYLDAAASVSASTTMSASAGISASAGVGWAKGRGFYPIEVFNPPHFSFTPPTISASGTVGANLTPTVDVLLDGVVGPQIALKGGLTLNADIHQNPWWTLTGPVDLTASIAIRPLGLTSPSLHVYQHTFPIANSGGRFGTGGGGGAGGGGSGGIGGGGGGGGGNCGYGTTIGPHADCYQFNRLVDDLSLGEWSGPGKDTITEGSQTIAFDCSQIGVAPGAAEAPIYRCVAENDPQDWVVFSFT